jgi:hypothetical protein
MAVIRRATAAEVRARRLRRPSLYAPYSEQYWTAPIEPACHTAWMSERAIYHRDEAKKCRWHAERMTDPATRAELLKLAREYIERAALIETQGKE